MDKPNINTFAYYHIFHNPISFREYWLPSFMKGFRKVRYYQYIHAHRKNLVEFDGRGTGKTEVGLMPDICQAMFIYPKEESVLTTYRMQHVAKPLDRIFSWFKIHPYWKAFVDSAKKTPVYKMVLKNGHVLYGISVGDSDQAEQITGVHCRIRFIDEFQFYPADGWKQFLGTTSEKGDEYTIDKFTGVPDGRVDTPANQVFKFDEDNPSKFDGNRICISRRMVPYFTTNDLREFKNRYRDEQEFKQEVDGIWGEPMWGYWDWSTIKSCINPNLHPISITIDKETYSKFQYPAQALVDLPQKPSSAIDCILGMDFGWSQPSIIIPFFLIEDKWRMACKISLINKMIPDHQAEIVDFIMDKYQATLCGIDFSGEKGLTTSLQNEKGRFSGKNYQERIVPVEFYSNMLSGYTENGTEIKEPVKLKTSEILKEMFAEGKFELFKDLDLQNDFNSERSTYTETTGKIRIATPHNVHIPETFRCFAFAYFTKYGTVTVPKRVKYKLVLPRIIKRGLRKTWSQRASEKMSS